ncbi:hypothetical protein GOODEAATRI_009431, partial [Goodea atripinnis]
LFRLGLRSRAECEELLQRHQWNLEQASTVMLDTYGPHRNSILDPVTYSRLGIYSGQTPSSRLSVVLGGNMGTHDTLNILTNKYSDSNNPLQY